MVSNKFLIVAGLILCLATPSLALVNGCVTYGANINGRETCVTCGTGFFRTTDTFFCNICPSGCVSCDIQGFCNQCSQGAYLANGQCQSCGTACARCNGSSCGVCRAGFSLVNGNCIRCIDNCVDCDINGNCVNCRQAYNIRNYGTSNQYCELGGNIRTGKALITLIIFGIICCLPMVTCCYCLTRIGGRKGANGSSRGGSDAGYNPNPFVNMNAQPVNTGYGAGYY